MTGRRRTRTALTAVAAAALAAAAATGPGPRIAFAQQERPGDTAGADEPGRATTAPTTAPAAELTAAQRVAEDVRQLAATLTAPAAADSPVTRADRDEAARRLIQRPGEAARRVLVDALRSPDNPAAKAAVARAIAESPVPPPADLLLPLLDLLNDADLVELAVQAVASYRNEPAALQRLIAVASDRQQKGLIRRQAALALGNFPRQEAARALERLLGAPEQPLRAAATAALGQMTGQGFGGDVQRWRAWLAESLRLTPAQWNALLLEERAADQTREARRHTELVNRFSALLDAQYRAAQRADRPALVLEYLNAPEPDLRRLAAQKLVPAAFQEGLVNDAIRQRLTELVGDSSADVRFETARALFTLNPERSLDSLLTQLAVERDESAKVAQIRALGRILNVRSVPQLRELLRDPSRTVARAAADALRSLGPTLREQDPTRAKQVADELMRIVRETTNNPDAQELRQSALEALVPLRHPDLLTAAPSLLDPDEPVGVRRAVLRGLGELGDPNAADIIIDWLPNERELGLRLDALQALGRTGGLEQAPTLAEYITDRGIAGDESVQAGAREVFKSLLPNATEAQLANEARRFRTDLDLRIPILQELVKRLDARGAAEDAAAQRVNVGDAYLDRKPPDPAAAVPFHRAALDYFVRQGGNENDLILENLTQQLLRGLLGSDQYEEAVRFGEEMITRDRRHQPTFGPAFWHEAERLANDARYDDALRLIRAARAMNPPLDDKYRDELDKVERDVLDKQGSE